MELAPDDPRWKFTTIETTDLTPDDVAKAVAEWVRTALGGDRVPIFRPGWWKRHEPTSR